MELQTGAVEKTTFALLAKLMNEAALADFFLVGGTALALRLGHRISVDLDMFTRDDIPVQALQKELAAAYGFSETFRAKNTLKGEIKGVKVDFITYDYPLLRPLEKTEENIRIADTGDIIAMKLSAITDAGTRMKDFVDIAFLSAHFTLKQMVGFYTEKYAGVNPISPVRALVYHKDINMSDTVRLTTGTFSWQRIQDRLYAMVDHPDRLFPDYPTA